MRKWNDKGPSEMQEFTKAAIVFSSVINAFTVMYILFTKQVSIVQVAGIISSILLIYLMLSGNMYRILRAYAEWKLKKRDNKWR